MREKHGKYRLGVLMPVCFLAFDLFTWGHEAQASGLGRPSVTVKKRAKKSATIKMKSGSRVTGYHIYLKEGKKGKYQLVKLLLKTNTVTLKKLKASSTYYVKVRSYRTVGLNVRTSIFSKVKKIAPYQKKKKPAATQAPTPAPTPAPVPSAAPAVSPGETQEPEGSASA